MVLLKAGLTTPLLVIKLSSFALLDGARFTVTVYVSMVTPSWAVTIVVILLLPTARAIAPDAEPDVTAVPFTVSVAVASLVVGVAVTDVMPLPTAVV